MKKPPINIFKAIEEVCSYIPHIVIGNQNMTLCQKVTKDNGILSSVKFSKRKCPTLGWIPSIFLHDNMGKDTWWWWKNQ